MPYRMGNSKSAGTWYFIDRRKPWQRQMKTHSFCKTGATLGGWFAKRGSFEERCSLLYTIQGMEWDDAKESLKEMGYTFLEDKPEDKPIETDEQYLDRIRQLLAA